MKIKNILNYLAIILLLLIFNCKSSVNTVDLKPPFENQGEHEAYLAQEIFKNEYRKQKYKVYTGKIEWVEKDRLLFEDRTLDINCSDTKKMIFEKGLIYPQLLYGYSPEPIKTKEELNLLNELERSHYLTSRNDSMAISNIIELHSLNISSKSRRFRFLLWENGRFNPIVYFFELTNKKADKNTDLKLFIEHSKLTFLKDGWVLI